MTSLNRRELFQGITASALGLSMRSAITGLPIPFLLSGDARAATSGARMTVLACSAQGESVNVSGPGTFDPNLTDYFDHPNLEGSDIEPVVVNGTTLTPADLATAIDTTFGKEPVTVARVWDALPSDLRAHLVWFNYRTGHGIHPKFNTVLRSSGQLRGQLGRGDEELPSAIAQETATLLGTSTVEPFVVGGSGYSYHGNPLASYSPTEVKQVVASLGATYGGPENFRTLNQHFIDQTYRELKKSGTPNQRRFFDEHALSQIQAQDFGVALGKLLETVEDDSIDNQLRVALALARLRLAPVIVTHFSFSGDNHSDDLIEVDLTLKMMRSLDLFWSTAKEFDVLDDIVFATATVFGRDMVIKDEGRGHHPDCTSGLILGTHLSGGVVGGYDVSSGIAKASDINTATGKPDSADVPADDSLAVYYRSMMRAIGVPQERRAVRFPSHPEVTSFS